MQLSGDGTLRQVPAYADGFAAQLAKTAGRQEQARSGPALLQMFGPARTYPTVSYYQALDPGQFLPEGFFRDRVVIVGLSLQNAPTLQAGGADAFATPFTVHTGQLVSGAEIQATIFDNITEGLFIESGRQPIVIAAMAFGALLAAAMVLRSTGWLTAALSVLVLLLFAAASYVLLRLRPRLRLAPSARCFPISASLRARPGLIMPQSGAVAGTSPAPFPDTFRRLWSSDLPTIPRS